MPALVQEGLMFFDDGVREVPRQDHDVRWFSFIEGLGGEDGKMMAGTEEVLLERAVIDDEIQGLAEVEMIEQGGGLGWGAESRHVMACGF